MVQKVFFFFPSSALFSTVVNLFNWAGKVYVWLVGMFMAGWGFESAIRLYMEEDGQQIEPGVREAAESVFRMYSAG